VRAALEGLKGVKKAQVSFAEKTAIVTYDPQAVNVKAMIQAVTRAGFSARERGKKLLKSG
jgi:copper chaperone CopZ